MFQVCIFLVIFGNNSQFIHFNYNLYMLDSISQTDQEYIERTRNLRKLEKYGSTVNRRLVAIYKQATGIEVENKTCCASERAIFYNEFLTWYESLI